jgi:hypothetical protein
VSVLGDVGQIAKDCMKIQVIARAYQMSQVILDVGDQDGESVLTLTQAQKDAIKARANSLLTEIKTLAAGLPSALP